MTTSLPDVLVGVQVPRLQSVPPRVSTAGDDAIDLAASVGLFLDPWQQLVLREAMGERADRKWSAFEVCLIVPRQCGKGSVLEALELAALFLADADAPPPLILHSAHEFKTSAEHFRRMRDLIERSPSLSSRVRIVRTAAGSEAIELHSGARIRFVTRSGNSGRGFSADLIVIDEAYNLTAESMAAVLPTMSARPNPQVWYTSSAGMPASDQLARLRQRGVAGSSTLAFLEWSAEDGADLDDPRVWASANPALGIRIPVDFVRAEREAMPDEQFARERLGIWQTVGGQHILPMDLWDALRTGDAEPNRPVLAVEVALDRSCAWVAAAQRSGDRVHVQLLDWAGGTEGLADELIRLGRKCRAPVAFDGSSEAAALAPELAAAGIKLVKVSGSDRAAACGAFHDLASHARLSHNGDPALTSAVADARWKDLGDGARTFTRRHSEGQVGPLYAVTFAAWGLSAGRSRAPLMASS